MTFERAPSEAALALEDCVELVMAALGHPDALVTDESLVRDFLDLRGRDHRVKRRDGAWVFVPAEPEVVAENEALLKAAHAKLGVIFFEGDLIIDVARRVRSVGRA